MSKSAICKIFYCLQMQNEKFYKRNNTENSYCKIYDELQTKLTPELLKLVDKLDEIVNKNWSEEVDFFFAEGFKLGLQIGMECAEN